MNAHPPTITLLNPWGTGSVNDDGSSIGKVIHLVASGDNFTDLGLKVTVGQLWWMSDDKYDALDATIEPA